MLFGKKKEKAAGIGKVLSIIGGIAIIIGFFLPLIKYHALKKATNKDLAPAQKQLEEVAHVPEGKEDEVSGKVSLFGQVKNKQVLYAVPVLGVVGILIGVTLYKLAFINILVGLAAMVIALFMNPFALGIGIFKFGHTGLWAICGGSVLMAVGGFMTFRKNSPKKKKKK